MNEVFDSPELRRISIDVRESTTEEEVLERFRVAKREFEAQRRQRILESAAYLTASYSTQYGGCHVQTPLTLQELRHELEKLPPKAVQDRLEELAAELGKYGNFEALFNKKMEESIPANWMYMWATREEAALALRKQNNDQLDTVQKAIPYLQENIQVHVDVLRQKQAFINEHEAEVPGLVKECTRLAKEATNIKSEVINLIRKLERGKERDKPKTTKKIISLILKQREIESNHDVATGKLALFTPDSPGVVTGLPAFPSSRYNLPRWLQSKLERIRR